MQSCIIKLKKKIEICDWLSKLLFDTLIHNGASLPKNQTENNANHNYIFPLTIIFSRICHMILNSNYGSN